MTDQRNTELCTCTPNCGCSDTQSACICAQTVEAVNASQACIVAGACNCGPACACTPEVNFSAS
jgi:hypothetical protein